MTALLETPTDDIFAKVKQLRDAGASIEQIKGYLATKGHISESGFTPFTDVPVEPTTTQPSLLSRAGSGVIGAIQRAVTHPLETAAGMASAPIHSLSDAFSPGVGESRHDPRLSKGGNSSGRPIDTSPYTAETGGVTGEQRAAGVAQTLANLVAPGMSKSLAGLTAAGGTLGAAYNPDDPAAGFLTGATLAPAVGGLAKAAPAAVSFARQIPPGGLRDVGLSLIPSRPLRAIKALRKLSPDDVNATTDRSAPARLISPDEAPPTPRAAPVAETAPADASGLSDADRARLIALGASPEAIAAARVKPKLTPADIVRSADPIAARSSPSPLSIVPDADAGAFSASRHRTAAQFDHFAESMGQAASQPAQSLDGQMATLLKRARNAQPNEIGATHGDAEEAMGLAPHQQPNLEDLLRQSIIAKGGIPK